VDLGIAGRTALVCASSRGLGRACAEALAAEGVNVVINGRRRDTLEQTAQELTATYPVTVVPVAADVTAPEGRALLLESCPAPDILVTNNAGPPPGPFLAHDHDSWISAIEANMVAALMLIRAVLPAMRSRRFGRIINITSAMVSSPLPDMGLSSGPRAGLTAVVKGLSREVAIDNVTINNLQPERIDTDRQRFMAQRMMDAEGVTYEEARARQDATMPTGRMGRPEELGATCAFLCSTWAGYLTGQSIRLDGGSHPGVF
jgi:3-oxoacyl-[acyl-carrier protein] reductase